MEYPTRAVLFDLGNTLVSYYTVEQFPVILRRCLAACLSRLPSGNVAGPDEELFTQALARNRESVDHTVRPLAQRLLALFPDCENDPHLLGELTNAFLEPIFATAILDPDALETLQRLRDAGMRTGTVSNTPWGSPAQTWREELARHGLLAAVDTSVFCMDVGFRKPHPAPIQRALADLNVDPREALFVGDDLRWDIKGAHAAGVRPIWINRLSAARPPDVSVPVIGDLRAVLRHID